MSFDIVLTKQHIEECRKVYIQFKLCEGKLVMEMEAEKKSRLFDIKATTLHPTLENVSLLLCLKTN